MREKTAGSFFTSLVCPLKVQLSYSKALPIGALFISDIKGVKSEFEGGVHQAAEAVGTADRRTSFCILNPEHCGPTVML